MKEYTFYLDGVRLCTVDAISKHEAQRAFARTMGWGHWNFIPETCRPDRLVGYTRRNNPNEK